MQIKLMKDNQYAPKFSVVEVDDITAKELKDAGIGVEFTEEIKNAEQKTAIKEIAIMPIEKKEVAVENKDVNILVKKFETKSFRDAILDLKSGKIQQIELKAPTGQDETDAADGLNLVYQGMDQLQGALEFGAVIEPKCKKLPAPGPSEYGRFIPYRDESTVNTTSALRVYKPGEGVAKTPSKLAFGKHDLKFGTDAIVTYLTEEILADVNYVEQYVVDDMRGRLGWQRDYDILKSTYSAAVNGFIGVFDGGAANFYVEPIAHNATYTGAIVQGIIKGVDPRLRAGAEWYMSGDVHSTLMGQLGMGTTVSTQPIMSMDGKTLASYPVNIMTQMSAFGAAGDILFGNFASGYAVCRKSDVMLTVSKDLAFLTDEVVLRATQRALGAPVYRRYAGIDAINVCAFSSTSGTA